MKDFDTLTKEIEVAQEKIKQMRNILSRSCDKPIFFFENNNQ